MLASDWINGRTPAESKAREAQTAPSKPATEVKTTTAPDAKAPSAVAAKVTTTAPTKPPVKQSSTEKAVEEAAIAATKPHRKASVYSESRDGHLTMPPQAPSNVSTTSEEESGRTPHHSNTAKPPLEDLPTPKSKKDITAECASPTWGSTVRNNLQGFVATRMKLRHVILAKAASRRLKLFMASRRAARQAKDKKKKTATKDANASAKMPRSRSGSQGSNVPSSPSLQSITTTASGTSSPNPWNCVTPYDSRSANTTRKSPLVNGLQRLALQQRLMHNNNNNNNAASSLPNSPRTRRTGSAAHVRSRSGGRGPARAARAGTTAKRTRYRFGGPPGTRGRARPAPLSPATPQHPSSAPQSPVNRGRSKMRKTKFPPIKGATGSQSGSSTPASRRSSVVGGAKPTGSASLSGLSSIKAADMGKMIADLAMQRRADESDDDNKSVASDSSVGSAASVDVTRDAPAARPPKHSKKVRDDVCSCCFRLR